jgi:acetolactate synthase-1/2/3 large subunit
MSENDKSKLMLAGKPFPVSHGVVEVLHEAGIDMIFGIPGGNMVESLFDALHEHQDIVRSVLVREESLAGIMAEVYGRLTRRPGVVIAQGAWIAAHAMIGALEAHLSSSPMLLMGDLSEVGGLSHRGPYQAGNGNYGSWDAARTLSGVTKLTMVPRDPQQSVQMVQLAVKHATSGEPGPVAVMFPKTALAGTVDPAATPRTYRTNAHLHEDRRGAGPQAVAEVARLLLRSERPVIIAGNGVHISQAYSGLAGLAERLGAPVATTPGGKSAFPETHEQSVGVFGTLAQPVANEVVGSADTVLVVGSKLGVSDTANESTALIDPERQTLIQIDVEPLNAAWTYPADLVLLGDARTVLGQLRDAVFEAGAGGEAGEDQVSARAARIADLAALKQKLGYFDEVEGDAEDSPLLPQRIIRGLQRAVDDRAIMCCDAGENRIFMTHYFQTKAPGTFVQAAGVGAMGYAIPAALAAKLVHPDRQVVAVCGDGGFAMTMNGLMTAREQRIPIVVVVFNNSALGWVKHEQEERGTEIASDLGRYDHAAIAHSLGCQGWRVATPAELGPALAEALACGEPAVVDVATSLSQSYRKVTSPLAL